MNAGMDEIAIAAEHFLSQLATATQGQARSLSPTELEWAKQSGVLCPQHIQVVELAEIPKPTHGVLGLILENSGLLNSTTAGLTFGNLVFIRASSYSERLLRHEFRHVYQWNTFHSPRAYLKEYMEQVSICGYINAPFERDARNFEKSRSIQVTDSWLAGAGCAMHTGFFIEMRPVSEELDWPCVGQLPLAFAYLGSVLVDVKSRIAHTACVRPIEFHQDIKNTVLEKSEIRIPVSNFEFRLAAVLNGHSNYKYGVQYLHLPVWRRFQSTD
ncbi:hypothetical protein RGQ30_20270 [Limnobacter thiooxidans]|uniref:DUF4157 domain-containing protein n=2 Tax=Limnobacter thiooxidans TaxID=131080 RepID=A0AA86JGA5_9BURK|nr:hypothetical protein RGQ30_20270 [Limnobacter thiooxidans]